MSISRIRCTLCGAIFLLIGLLVNGQAPKSPSAEVDKCCKIEKFANCKYKAVPLVLSQDTNTVFVDMEIDNQKCTLLLDTGASSSSLDAAFVKKSAINLLDFEFGVMGFFDGTKISTKIAVSRSNLIGDFKIDCPLPWCTFDMTKMIQNGKPKDIPEMHGILGLDVLKQYSAIIDLPNSQMLLIDPMDFHDKLQGIWQGTSMINGEFKNNANHLALTR